MAISVHGRATVDDSMLLYRAAHRFALFHLFPARADDKTYQPPKTLNHVVTMADAQSSNAFIIFFSLVHTHRHRYKYVHDATAVR